MVKTEMFGGLKPCPKCKSENLGAEQAPLGVAYQIGCVDCGYCGPMIDLSSGNAGEAWNNRADLENLIDKLGQCLKDISTLKNSELDGLNPFAECELNDACFDMDKVIAGVNAALRDPKEPRMGPGGFYYEPEEEEMERLGTGFPT